MATISELLMLNAPFSDQVGLTTRRFCDDGRLSNFRFLLKKFFILLLFRFAVPFVGTKTQEKAIQSAPQISVCHLGSLKGG